MGSLPVLELRQQLLHEQVAAQLRDLIIEGEFAPDVVIDEMALCARFAISRTPLREALKVLAAEDLVVLLPRKGAVVSRLTAAAMAQKFEVVRLIECHSLKFLADRGDAVAIAELISRCDRVALAFRQSRKRYHEANQEFHRGLVEMTGNAELVRIHAQLLRHLQRGRYLTGQDPHRRGQFNAEHQEMAEHLRGGRYGDAVAALGRHLDHVAAETVRTASADE